MSGMQGMQCPMRGSDAGQQEQQPFQNGSCSQGGCGMGEMQGMRGMGGMGRMQGMGGMGRMQGGMGR
jgi:hypothetical protein